MPSIWFKMSYRKIPHLKFWRFFRQSVTKIMGKTGIWTILCFSPLPLLNNVDEQWAKLASSNVMGSEHGIGGKGSILNLLSKIPVIFCYWLSEIYKKKEKKKLSRVLMRAVANNSSLLLWVWLCYITLWHEHNDRKPCQNNA